MTWEFCDAKENQHCSEHVIIQRMLESTRFISLYTCMAVCNVRCLYIDEVE